MAVASFAAIVSYAHIYDLGSSNGQYGTAAILLPLSVDGIIVAASLVLLYAARRKIDTPALAQWMLVVGVAATVAANVTYGAAFGWVGAIVSAWPALSFIGSVEMLMGMIRNAPEERKPRPQRQTQPESQHGQRVKVDALKSQKQLPPAPASSNGHSKTQPDALQQYIASASDVPSERQVMRDLKVGRPNAKLVRQELIKKFETV